MLSTTRRCNQMWALCWAIRKIFVLINLTYSDFPDTVSQKYLETWSIWFTNQVCKVSQPSRHKTLSQRWFDVGPPSTTLDQRQTNIDSTPCVCWVACIYFSYIENIERVFLLQHLFEWVILRFRTKTMFFHSREEKRPARHIQVRDDTATKWLFWTLLWRNMRFSAQTKSHLERHFDK